MVNKRLPKGSLFTSENELGDHILAHPKLLDSLVVRRYPAIERHGELDVLTMDGRGRLNNVELKYQKTCGSTMGQILDYARGVSRLTMENIVELAATGPAPIDLPADFEKRFGRPLPRKLGGRPRTTLIASRFDRRTFNGIEYLQGERVPIRAMQYVERGQSVQLIRFTAEDLERQERRSELEVRAAARRRARLFRPQPAYEVHDDFFDFWALHSCRLVWDFVPSSFVFALYEEWRRTEALRGWPREQFASGHLGRQLKQLVIETGGWSHCPRFCAGSLMDAYEPLAASLAWTKPAPNQPVAGYVRDGFGAN